MRLLALVPPTAAVTLLLAAGCHSAERAVSEASPSPTATAPTEAKDPIAFEMHLGFDSEGRERKRVCVVRVPREVGIARLDPTPCPASVVVTVGTKDDALGIMPPRP